MPGFLSPGLLKVPTSDGDLRASGTNKLLITFDEVQISWDAIVVATFETDVCVLQISKIIRVVIVFLAISAYFSWVITKQRLLKH